MTGPRFFVRRRMILLEKLKIQMLRKYFYFTDKN